MVLMLSPEADRILHVSIHSQLGVVAEVRSSGATHTGWLAAIDEVLTKAHCTLRDITGIVLVQNPSSFTGTRLMHTIGNTFAYAQHIPIIAVQASQAPFDGLWLQVHDAPTGMYISPTYSGEPNIGPLSV